MVMTLFGTYLLEDEKSPASILFLLTGHYIIR
jgi:hypothetical protein